MQNTSTGTIRKAAIERLRQSDKPGAPKPSWNTKVTAPNAAATDSRFKGHGFQWNERAAERDRQDQQRRADHEQHDQTQALLDSILVIDVERGYPAQLQARPGQSSELGGILGAELAHHGGRVGRGQAPARQELDEQPAAVV